MNIKKIENNYPSDLLRIEYMLGNVCNYKCWYCFPGSNEGDMPWPDIDLAKKNIYDLLSYYKNQGKNKFQFYLIGGEPTIWKELPNLITHLKSSFNCNFSISTNASRSVNWWRQNAHNFDSIEISVHHQFVDLNHIKQVIKILQDKKIEFVVNVLMDPDNFDKCKKIIENLKTKKNKFTLIAKYVHFNGMTRYDENQKEYFENHIKQYPSLWDSIFNKNKIQPLRIKVVTENDQKIKVKNDSWFSLNKLNHFQGWSCNLGKDHIVIQSNGIISGNCNQKIYGSDSYYNLYDNQFKEKFIPIIQPTICKKNTCECKNEIVIRKNKIA
jgi:organic radical activating enzyme